MKPDYFHLSSLCWGMTSILPKDGTGENVGFPRDGILESHSLNHDSWPEVFRYPPMQRCTVEQWRYVPSDYVITLSIARPDPPDRTTMHFAWQIARSRLSRINARSSSFDSYRAKLSIKQFHGRDNGAYTTWNLYQRRRILTSRATTRESGRNHGTHPTDLTRRGGPQ